MNINQILEAVDACWSIGKVPYLIGKHGVGKTTLVSSYQESGRKVIHIRLANLDPGELGGYPYHCKETNTLRYAKPDWWPELGEKAIIFFDEFNRAPNNLHQAMFQLLNEGRIHELFLPKDTNVICASNPETNDYKVTKISDRALKSRLIELKFEPSFEDWETFQKKYVGDSLVTSFFKEHPHLLNKGEDFSLYDDVVPCNKNATAYSLLCKTQKLTPHVDYVIRQALLGREAANMFSTYLEEQTRVPNALDILTNYTKNASQVKMYVENNQLEKLALINEHIINHFKETPMEEIHKYNFTLFANYLCDLPKESFMQIMLAITNTKEILEKVIGWFDDNKELCEYILSFNPNVEKEIEEFFENEIKK